MGVVSRVTGPVVIAEDLAGGKMFDVVRVGTLGLVGEIIRLVGGQATVQVYEDTTGIRPGDPVENTGQALSVELGPGLLASIYDGVQRPLNVLRENLGDFISRGFVAPPLDEKRRWEFTATVAAGDSVTPGAVLGTVQETPLILHKVMVPVGLSGTVSAIASGSYTIREPIGSLRTASGPVPLTLTQRWVVRVPRPVRQKLAPGIPLVSGQRVIDTFFPVAKGGTAAIPGPFGSGKCVAGETPVVLATGEIVPIEALHATARRTGDVRVDGTDEWVELSRPIELYSLVGHQLVTSRTTTLYKGKSDSLVRLRTRSGRSVRVSPVHRLFTVGPDGTLRESMARELQAGAYLAAVRRVPAPDTDAALPLGPSNPNRQRESTTVPFRMSPRLGEFLGLFAAAGHLRGARTAVFLSSDGVVISRFVALTRALFGVDRPQGLVGVAPRSVLLRSRSIVRLLRIVGVGGTGAERRVPAPVLASTNEVLAAFLRGWYLAGGRRSDGEVEFRALSREGQTDLSYALTRFGVVSSLARRWVHGANEFPVTVRGFESLSRLQEFLGLGAHPFGAIARTADPKMAGPVMAERTTLTGLSYSGLLEPRTELSEYLGDPHRTGAFASMESRHELGAAARPTPPEPGATGFCGLQDWLYPDEVVSAETEDDGPYDVYDVALPDHGCNFVGGFGGLLLHNTVTQQQLAKWSDTDIVVYVGCGERGNEMTEVLATFPHLKDPKSGRPLMERTILIANTSNMPVAAREASVYTGITIAEYYRDMGYDVAVMADSTSRWAEAMREISGRLEEMPGEEGYPAYLGRRVAEFYERAGRVVTLSPEGRLGSITVVGAVSPPGGDFSEPVSQNTLRVTRVFWALDASLASRRHFPSINWLQSYSLYLGDLEPWYRAELARDFVPLRQKALQLLQKEAELQEIVQLVGVDALPEREKGILDVARMLREDYLQQSAYDEVDTYTSIQKQYRMLRSILSFGDREQEAIAKGMSVSAIQKLPVRSKLSRMKWIPEKEHAPKFEEIETDIRTELAPAAAPGG